MSGPLPRVCVLKREEGQSFGFELILEQGRPGHVIRRVQISGVAERSGLRDGDRLLEVNEKFVDDLEHMEVVRMIQMSGPQLCFLLLSSDEYEQAVAQEWNLKELCRAQRGENWNPPRLCHIVRNPASGLGFSINHVEACLFSQDALRNGLVTTEILMWFYIGEIIGKGGIVGYDV
ncbi:Na(+)/H(+) exchange regulatory cofactor NHE-RF3 [Bagarius yarrelli]|uniref:Na(+)/H(+) exchange regulatory cofactor NHE-RF3 n=1 Tax=Bagarius yarrelli TaxID=175774 RepID=A0A556V817_BAGYA|nr:Na(+)/H(+) exchange regulatory cofactor NHE-RF3 [Bagarius yarrelli]